MKWMLNIEEGYLESKQKKKTKSQQRRRILRGRSRNVGKWNRIRMNIVIEIVKK